MFGRGDRDRFASRFDARFREGDRSVLMSKFASSAAHLAGKRFTSAEAFTWMGEHFCETLEETKALGDLFFLAGVNRLYYHAMVYSPDSAPWPGWCFYAASELNPRNPLWRDIRPLNDYFTRVQTQAAAPLTLSLGDVCHTARVRVNGKPIATLFMHPYATTIRGRAGTNVLEIEVTNLGANRIRAYDRKGVAWKTFEDANVAFYRGRGVLDASKWPVLPSGLLGPVVMSCRETGD